MPRIAELLLEELEREAAGTRRALERVPEGQDDWKPHEKSMPLGYLATLIATMPSWAASIVNLDELDIGGNKPGESLTNRQLLELFDQSVGQAREALSQTTDEHLMTPWRLLVNGQVVLEQPRYVAIRDSAFNHLAHHRGQLTVYLRLNDIPVPSLYGPTADEKTFG